MVSGGRRGRQQVPRLAGTTDQWSVQEGLCNRKRRESKRHPTAFGHRLVLDAIQGLCIRLETYFYLMVYVPIISILMVSMTYEGLILVKHYSCV